MKYLNIKQLKEIPVLYIVSLTANKSKYFKRPA